MERRVSRMTRLQGYMQGCIKLSQGLIIVGLLTRLLLCTRMGRHNIGCNNVRTNPLILLGYLDLCIVNRASVH